MYGVFDMKVLVTGSKGQLGSAVVREVASRGCYCIPSYFSNTESQKESLLLMPYVKLDITDAQSVRYVMKKFAPDVVIHCAAWTDVEGAEKFENVENVKSVNVRGTENIVTAARLINAKLIYISTDYVFGGGGEEPWKPDDKNFDPLNFYGQTKLEGELIVSNILEKYFIVRTEWLFGQNGNNFVKKMIAKGSVCNTVKVVSDQIGTPTYTEDLAKLLVDMSYSEKYGYYHATNEGGYVSWYDFCLEIYKLYGLKTMVLPVSGKEYTSFNAKRPCNSRFDKSKLIKNGFDLLPSWQNALCRYLKEKEF